MRFALIGVWLAVLAAVAWANPVSDDKIQILTTAPDLRVIAEQVGGEHVEARSLLKGPEDPHFAEAKPAFIKLANKADVFIKIGMSLELGYEPAILAESRNAKIQPGAAGHLDASLTIPKLEVPTGTIDRSLGDVHPDGNPHYLLDPMNAKRVAQAVRDVLSKTSPGNGKEFESRCADFCKNIDEAMFGPKILKRFSPNTLADLLASGKLAAFLKERNAETEIGGWAADMLPLSGKEIAVYHKNLSYFVHRFHMQEAASLEPKPGVQPSSKHLASVIETIKSRGIKAVFYTTFQSAKAVEKVCEETGAARVLYPHQVNAIENTGDYIKMIDVLVKSSVAALHPSGQ
jgi:zinc/manganese transport system substrate-binding protein